jgi:hypothetical protein
MRIYWLPNPSPAKSWEEKIASGTWAEKTTTGSWEEKTTSGTTWTEISQSTDSWSDAA